MTDKVKHSFLFEEAAWKAEGLYFHADGRAVPAEGRTRITHLPDIWINDGYMRVLVNGGAEFSNRYEIQPFGPNDEITTWRSRNPALEDLSGQFIIIEETIISPWQSQSGAFHGAEVMIMVAPGEYLSRGYAMHGREKLSSWAVRLLKEEFEGTF